MDVMSEEVYDAEAQDDKSEIDLILGDGERRHVERRLGTSMLEIL